jgi:eukaryotic-like serine/threonine-protein kinase
MSSAAPDDNDLPPVSPGDMIAGKYRVERVLGAGGMAFVVAALHEELDQLVAIKLLRPELQRYEVAAARFLREARAAARIQSDHVARVFDVGSTESGQAYMVMEYLEGTNLEELLADRRRLPIEEAVDHMLEALEAVAQAHAIGIVHRDLKPANLFLARRRDGSERIKILDFGISKATERASAKMLTSPNTVLGSPQYMSPEQALTPTDVDLRTDLWSLGVILHELIAGWPPFEGDTPASMLASIASKPPIPVRTKRPDAPVELERVIMRCLERDRDKRYANAAELAYAIVPFSSERTKGLPARISQVLGVPPPKSAPRESAKAAAPASGKAKDGSEAASAVAGASASARRPRRQSNTLVLALIAVVLLGLGMIASAAWQAAQKLTLGEDGGAPSASGAPTGAPTGATATTGARPAPSPTSRAATPRSSAQPTAPR